LQNKFITIEGNIGSGKTTLARLLSETYNGRLLLEGYDDNPFLPKFYLQPDKYALQTEMAFLLERYQQMLKIMAEPTLFNNFTVSDYMFTKSLLFAKMNLSSQDYKLYHSFFKHIEKKIIKPEIIYYLHVDTEILMRNIKKRGRPYELNIQKPYLNRIEKMYFNYFKQSHHPTIVIINVGEKDWVQDAFAYQSLLTIFDQAYEAGKINYITF
jgi:deoxyadenosine/deoxycytidine kinase